MIAWFWWTRRTPDAVDAVITRCLAFILGAAALALLLQPMLRRIGLSITAAGLDRAQRDKLALTIIAGAVLGAGVALTSVGAGALGVVALLALYPLRLTPDRLVATDIAHALPITILAAAGHAALGHTDLRVLACLLVGSIRRPARLTRLHSPARTRHTHPHRDHAGSGQCTDVRLRIIQASCNPHSRFRPKNRSSSMWSTSASERVVCQSPMDK